MPQEICAQCPWTSLSNGSARCQSLTLRTTRSVTDAKRISASGVTGVMPVRDERGQLVAWELEVRR